MIRIEHSRTKYKIRIKAGKWEWRKSEPIYKAFNVLPGRKYWNSKDKEKYIAFAETEAELDAKVELWQKENE